MSPDRRLEHFNQYSRSILSHTEIVQYDGSNDDLDWRIEFRYPNFICIMKYLRSRLIKGGFIE